MPDGPRDVPGGAPKNSLQESNKFPAKASEESLPVAGSREDATGCDDAQVITIMTISLISRR